MIKKKFSQNIEYLQNHETCTGSAQCFSGKVTKVIDGDTLDVEDQRIRLSLINTPERNQYGYFESKNLVESLCGVGTKVIVDQDDGQTAGSYDRLVGVVYCGDSKISLNEILLESKNAKILKKICYKSEFSNTMWAQKFGC